MSKAMIKKIAENNIKSIPKLGNKEFRIKLFFGILFLISK